MKRPIGISLAASVVLIFTVAETFAQGYGSQQGYPQQGTKGHCKGGQQRCGGQAGAMRKQMMQRRYRDAQSGTGNQYGPGYQYGTMQQQRSKNGSGVGQYGRRGGGMGQGRMQGRQGSGRMGAGQSGYGRQGSGKGQGRMQGRRGADLPSNKNRNNSTATDASLSQEEIESILFMREEEKLARDVYLALGKQWNVPVFANIARSESRHMDTFKGLIKRYGLQDPVVDDTPGVFTNQKFSKLYNDLVRDGSVSLTAAHKVGVKIEELDIADLQEGVSTATHSDIQRVYKNLLRASQNHLKSFTSQR